LQELGDKDHFTGYLRVDVIEYIYSGGATANPTPAFAYVLVPLLTAVTISVVTIAGRIHRRLQR
jgi:hypothetical protein